MTPFGSWQASCRGNVTLLYVRTMMDFADEHGKPVGLSRAIEKKFGIKTRKAFSCDPTSRGRLNTAGPTRSFVKL